MALNLKFGSDATRLLEDLIEVLGRPSGTVGHLVSVLMPSIPLIERAKAELAEMTVEAEVGGGAVKAIADGTMRIRAVHIDPAMMSVLVADGEGQDRAVRMSEGKTPALNSVLLVKSIMMHQLEHI